MQFLSPRDSRLSTATRGVPLFDGLATEDPGSQSKDVGAVHHKGHPGGAGMHTSWSWSGHSAGVMPTMHGVKVAPTLSAGQT